jgi:bacillolysin
MVEQQKSGLTYIPLFYCKITPSVACQAANTSQSNDPRTGKIVNRLRECVGAIQSGQQKTSAMDNLTQSKQGSQVAKLRKQLSEELDIRFNPTAGTPRQIKVKPEAKRKGVVLERAKQGTASRRESDEKTAKEFLRSKRNMLHISTPDAEQRLSRYKEDELGRRHLRYEQIYKGLRVWPAELNIHLDKDGNADLMNGAYVPTPRRLITKPVWDADAAIRQARSAVNGGGNAKASNPELIVYAPGDKIPRLAWKMELEVSLDADWLVVIDALNGKTLTSYNQVMNENVSGSGMDLFGKKQQLNIWHEGSQYYMIDTSKSMYDATSDPPALDNTRGAIMIYDMNNNDNLESANLVKSQGLNSGWLSDSVSLSWCISKTYDYYLSRHSRISFDGEGSSIFGFVRDGNEPDGASFNTDLKIMKFGGNQPFAGALDVVAHEFTHGVTGDEAALIYQNQSGALSEAFSDIFGEMVEAYAIGHCDWITGTSLGIEIRNSKSPSSPSKMSEYDSTYEDYGGVHINCTIISHCFYLLAEGMQGAIGLRNAERIFYKAQKYHLLQNSQFIDCRLACIASAEEIFGQGSLQSQKVAEAFDLVEIFDNTETPEPPPITPVSGDDSAVFIFKESDSGNYFLGRREEAFGDPAIGSLLSCYDVIESRPSVSGDGSLAFFVDSINDACFISTDGSVCEECLGFSGEISSVAMSPDGQVYGFVLLDESGEKDNSIMVIDLRPGGQSQTYTLIAPSIDGVAMNTVQFADAMDFSSDNRFLFYDAYNVLQFNDGSMIGVWSIYAIDLLTEQTISLFGPLASVDVGYPAISQTTNHLMAFDVLDEATGISTILAVNLISLDYGEVGTVAGGYGVPGYTGDDSAIVYTRKDASTSTGYSLMRRSLAQNGVTPTGNPILFMKDAAFGVIYRRGIFTPPAPKISVSPGSLPFGIVPVGGSLRKQITISNTSTGDLNINGISISGVNVSQYKIVGGCAGQTLPATGTCKFYVDFLPTSAGVKNATLSIKSNDAAVPTRNTSYRAPEVFQIFRPLPIFPQKPLHPPRSF